jgi:hypothetical protein
MRDEDLLKMVYLDSDQYRSEALTYAKAEIRQRGITFDRTDLNIAGASMPTLSLAAFGQSLWRARGVLAFALGFAGCLAWFAWLNCDSYRNMYKAHCEDCFVFFGFPFDLYQTGGFAGPTTLLWDGLIWRCCDCDDWECGFWITAQYIDQQISASSGRRLTPRFSGGRTAKF